MNTKWQTVKLAELANIKIGPFGSALKIGELKEQGPVRVLYIENIVGNNFDPSKEKFINADKYKGLKQYTVEPEDIVVTIMGTIGRTALVPEGIGTTIISSHLIKITVNKELLLPEYLNYAFQDSLIADQIMAQSKGAIMKGLNSSILKNLQIPLPSIDEQRKIIDRLKAIKKLDELNSRLILNTQELYASTLNASISANGSISEQQLSDICDIITDGAHNVPPLEESGVPMLDGSDIDNMVINSQNPKKFISRETDNILAKRCKPKQNDILVSSRGTIGKIAIVKKQDFNIMGNIILVRPNSEKLNSKFLANYFIVNRDNFLRKALGTSQKGLYLKDVRALQVKVPSLDIQQQIVGKLDAIQDYNDILIRQKDLFKELFSSTLHKSLSRELMPALSQKKVGSVNNFAIQQAIGALLSRGFKRGEMAIAKVLYLTQEVYAVPIGIQFSQQNFGPYDAAVRKALTSGLTQNNQFFRKSGTTDRPYYELGIKGDKILKYQTAAKTGQVLDVLLPKISNADSVSVERLATVCKVIQDNKTIEAGIIVQKTNEWKPNKFTNDQINKSLNFIKSQGWHTKLLED